MTNNINEIAFLKSAIAVNSDISINENVIKWLKSIKEEVLVEVQQVPLSELRSWAINPNSGNITHQSGRFFSIEGIEVNTNWSTLTSWDQPIINQPEVGYLGILTKKFNGVLHFLMQAKIEPGNINIVQISPTLQATKSNYTQVHNGAKPLFLEYFNGEKKVDVLLDQLQSEQGARFLKKRNRNIIIEVDSEEEILLPKNFIWLTLGQIISLMRVDNLINMDTRTVISGIPYGSYTGETLNFYFALRKERNLNEKMLNSAMNNEIYLNSFVDILSWITKLKSKYDLIVRQKNIKLLDHWGYVDGVIKRHDNKYFSVIGVNVKINNREVLSWDQPMIKPAQEGLIAFIVKSINGVYHFLVQAKLEPGNFDVIEIAPTVQCLTGNYRKDVSEYAVPYIDVIQNATQKNILYSSMQSEEGGRFYREQNLNMIVEVGEDFDDKLPEKYCWMTLHQIKTLVMYNNYLNIAARSLLSAISF